MTKAAFLASFAPGNRNNNPLADFGAVLYSDTVTATVFRVELTEDEAAKVHTMFRGTRHDNDFILTEARR